MIIKFISSHMIILLIHGITWVNADQLPHVPESVTEQKSIPIVPLPSCPFTQIRQKMISEKDFEFAILETAPQLDGFYWAYVVRESHTGYRVYIKKISTAEIIKDNKIESSLVNDCKVSIMSKAIDGDSVKILSDTLRNRVLTAKFQTVLLEPVELDGTAYEVYVKGNINDLNDIYAGKLIDGTFKNSYSCSTIAFALAHLVLSDVDQKPSRPLEKLKKYLDNPETEEDPYIEMEEPALNFELPSH